MHSGSWVRLVFVFVFLRMSFWCQLPVFSGVCRRTNWKRILLMRPSSELRPSASFGGHGRSLGHQMIMIMGDLQWSGR